MYARVTRVKGDPAKLDQTVGDLRDRMVPVFKQQAGYLGVASVANRETGEGATTTYWDSMEHLQASEAAIFAARDQFASDEGLEVVSFHRCEVAVLDRVKDPVVGTAVRAITLRGGAPERADEGIAAFKDRLLPIVKAQPGYRGAQLLVDRENQVAFTVTSWDSPAERDASNQALAQPREEAAQGMDMSSEVQVGEITLMELSVPAPT